MAMSRLLRENAPIVKEAAFLLPHKVGHVSQAVGEIQLFPTKHFPESESDKLFLTQGLPNFGEFAKQRQEALVEDKAKRPPLTQHEPQVHRPAYQPKKNISTIKVRQNFRQNF